jgi:predicted  nucleic acid-binding Zn-ribbon protein
MAAASTVAAAAAAAAAAATVATSEDESPARFFDELKGKQFHFARLRQLANLESNTFEELARARAEFKRLKAAYLACETKQGVLESLVKEGVLDAASEDQVRALEGAVALGKEGLETVRGKIAEASRRVQEIIRGLVSKWEQFESESRELAALVDKENAEAANRRAELAANVERNANSNWFGKSAPELLALDTEEKCNAVITNQIAMIQRLESETQQIQEDITALEAASEPLKGELAQLKQRLQEVEQKHKKALFSVSAAAAQTEDAPQQPLEAELALYGPLVEMLSRLGCARVTLPSAGAAVTLSSSVIPAAETAPERVLVAELATEPPLRVEVHWSEGWRTFARVVVSPAVVFTSDIVEYATETQDLGFLVRELRARVANDPARRLAIRALCKRYACRCEETDTELLVRLDCGVTCRVYVGLDYPASSGACALLSLEAASAGWDREKLATVAAAVNAMRLPKLSGLLSEVETRLLALARPA